MEAAARSVQIEFPHFAAALLETLNKHRLEGKFCDIAVHVQGRVFHAHKSVLAAASPYFHDKLLLQDTSCLALPSVIEPDTFENLLQLIYSGRLKLLVEALPSHLLVASGLQMWQVVDQCSAILKELEGGPYRPWSSRASENQSPSSSNYFAVKEDGELGGSGERGMVAAARGVPGCPDDEVMKIRVSHEEEEEEEEDKHPAGICSGSLDKSMKIVLKDDEEVGLGVSKGPASAEPDGPFPSPRDHPKIYYIKQERFDPEEAAVAALGSGAGAVGEACFLKSLAQGRALGIAEVHGLYQASLQPGSGSEVSYIVPAAGSAATTAIASSSSSLAAPGFTIKAQPLPSDEVGFPQSSWKPVDLHGNEIIAHTVHGQVVHAPVKIVAAPDGKKFGCLCGKRFAVKPKRDRHIMLTFSLRPFGCSVCNKKFKLKHHLTEHMKTHDGNLYSCEDCGRKFRVQNCFLKHKELCKGQGWATACWTYK